MTEMALLPDPVVSVVICTHNRLNLLTGCLESMLRQQADPSCFEVLVINNSSTDGTVDFLSSFSSASVQFRWVTEPKMGLSYARNRGWQEARGTYVAYIDDDAEATDDWISAILSFVARFPDIVAFGGPYSAFSTVPVPAWFPPEYGTMDLGSEERPLVANLESVIGLNMAFRKDALQACGGFHPDLGMKGNKVSYGEEIHVQSLLRNRGYDIYYLPAMSVRHYLPAYKMSFLWLMKSVFAVGTSWSLTVSYQRSFTAHCAGIAYGCLFFAKHLVNRDNIPFKRLLYFALKPLVSEIGALIEYLRGKCVGLLKGRE